MAITTTTPDVIRERLARLITWIVPRREARRDERWVWRDRQEIAGRLRNFDVLVGIETVTPGGWHGGGIELQAEFTIRAAYPADAEEGRRLAGYDSQDLAALLVRFHQLELAAGDGGAPGVFPVEMEPRRGAVPLLTPVGQRVTEGEQLYDFVVTIHWFADDSITLQDPAPTS